MPAFQQHFQLNADYILHIENTVENVKLLLPVKNYMDVIIIDRQKHIKNHIRKLV